MNLSVPLPKIDSQKNMVVDVTYLCNYSCNYCRWGSSDTPNRAHQKMEHILVDKRELRTIGVERIVLSGGEPLLHPNIGKIINHYAEIVDDVILITNGWLADLSKIKKMIDFGLTGIAFSIDSVDGSILQCTRDMSSKQVERSITNFQLISHARKSGDINVELGINCVVSSANCSVETIANLLDWSLKHDLDYVNFNMIFDDGYTGENAPNLLLNDENIEDIIKIANLFHTDPPKIHTNSYKFWLTMASMLNGSKLDGKSCGLRDRQTILYRGRYHFCAWLESPTLGRVGATTPQSVYNARQLFHEASKGCHTGPHCHCLQTTDHQWEMID